MFRVGGFGFDFVAPSGPVTSALAAWLAPFEVSARQGCRIRLSLDRRGEFTGIRTQAELIGDAGGYQLAQEDFEARIAADLSQADIAQSASIFPTQSVLKLLIGEHLQRHGGLLCHGVALSDGRGAALFVGDSGAGKSTLGELGHQAGLQRLSDELVAVAPAEDGDGFTAEGTPWNIGQPLRAPLRTVGLLAHAPTHSAEELSPAEVLRVLLPNALMPGRTAQSRHRMFDIAQRLLSRVRCVRLHFAKDTAVADVVRTLL